ncbi:MAG: hypothetical protein IJR46_02240, partial [Neisseriaceae bacterium]|nr:hypothetical protein [Neisseriaceae bacterium]
KVITIFSTILWVITVILILMNLRFTYGYAKEQNDKSYPFFMFLYTYVQYVMKSLGKDGHSYYKEMTKKNIYTLYNYWHYLFNSYPF